MSNSSFIVSAGYDLSIKVTPLFPDQKPFSQNFQVNNSQVNRIIPFSNSQFFAATNPYIMLFDINQKTPAKPTQISGHQTNVTDIAVGKQFIYSCSEDRSWKKWDITKNFSKVVSTQTQSAINAIYVNSQETMLITANEKGKIDIYDLISNSVCRSQRISQVPIRSMAVTKDGRTLIAACQNHEVIVLDPQDFQVKARWIAHNDVMLRVVLSPDEKTFVTTSADSTAKVWSMEENYKEISTLSCEKKWVWDAAYSPDSKTIVTAGTDAIIRVWTPNDSEQKNYTPTLKPNLHAKGITALSVLTVNI